MNAAYKYQSHFDGVGIVTDDKQNYILSNSKYLGGGRDGEVFQLNENLAVKMYINNPINSMVHEKLITLSAQHETFHELVITPIQLVRLESQKRQEAAGYIMKYLPDAKPLDNLGWTKSIEADEEDFDQTTANIIYDLSTALENLHMNRVFICDLKPDNILVAGQKPHIIDFDSCSMPNYPGETITIPYVDPRIRDGVPKAVGPNEEFSALTDWWALGVIVFQLFMGVIPWAGNHPQMRKDALAVRSYNYSAVILDPMVRPPKIGMRDPDWLESKPELKNYFKKIFSPDPTGRISPTETLNKYFPKEEISERIRRANKLIDKLMSEARLREFWKGMWDDMINKAREQATKREQSRIDFLDFMYK